MPFFNPGQNTVNGEIILLSRHINGIILPSRHMQDTFFVLKGESWAFPAG